jgi:hypothetical protein
MKETDKEYYTRRGGEERKRARSAATLESQSLHSELSDLYHERANGPANVNSKKGIQSTNLGAVGSTIASAAGRLPLRG